MKIKLFENATYEEASRMIRFQKGNEHLIDLSLGVDLHPRHKPFDCGPLHGEGDHSNVKCLEWYNQAR
jgi:hypothetical protein